MGVGAVHAGAAGVDQVFHLVMAAAFEQVDETHHVALDVGVGVFQRIAHPRLGREIDGAVEALGGEQRFHRLALRHIHLDEAEAGKRLELLDAGFFQADVVVIAEVVDADHFGPLFQQALGDMHADESGGAGNQNFHFVSFK